LRDPTPGPAPDTRVHEAREGLAFRRALAALAEDAGRERIFLSDLLDALGERALTALMLVFALPNALPAPPGTSALLGLPLLFLTAQMTTGRPAWLPAMIARRSVTREHFETLMRRTTPWLTRAAGMLRPRLSSLTGPLAMRLVGALCLVLALVLFLPIPFGNMPPAIAISVIALGLLARDGAWVLAGSAIGVVSIAIAWGVVLALLRYGGDLLMRVFG
jgi:hypothetical protein